MKQITHNPIRQQKPQRVAIFSGNYNYVMDGPVRALNKLVAHLESRGVQVLVFAPTAKKTAFEHCGTLVSVPSIALPGRSEYRLALGLPPKQQCILKEFSPDIVHVAAPDWLGHTATDWAKKHGIPAVASFHTRFDTYPRYYHMAWAEKYITRLMRRFYRRCERIYVPSRCMVDLLQQQKMAKDIRIWSRGVDTEIFTPARCSHQRRSAMGIKTGETVILFVGRLVLEKGLGVFADALDELDRRGTAYRAVIVGEGPEREHFAARLPQAIFTGYLKGQALAEAYASANIFFNASTTETFGNVTLEAMASGLPAVCADATGSRSLVENGKTGYLVPAQTNGAYADKLELLLTDSGLRHRFAKAATEKAANFHWANILENMLIEYSEVIASAAESAGEQPQTAGVLAAE